VVHAVAPVLSLLCALAVTTDFTLNAAHTWNEPMNHMADSQQYIAVKVHSHTSLYIYMFLHTYVLSHTHICA
jgi:hypothetical protein